MKGHAREDDETTERIVKALSNPIRRRIVGHFLRKGGSLSPVQTQRDLGSPSLSNLVYHFNVLRNLEVINLVSTRQVRGGTEHFYDLEDDLARHPLTRIMVQGSEGAQDD